MTNNTPQLQFNDFDSDFPTVPYHVEPPKQKKYRTLTGREKKKDEVVPNKGATKHFGIPIPQDYRVLPPHLHPAQQEILENNRRSVINGQILNDTISRAEAWRRVGAPLERSTGPITFNDLNQALSDTNQFPADDPVLYLPQDTYDEVLRLTGGVARYGGYRVELQAPLQYPTDEHRPRWQEYQTYSDDCARLGAARMSYNDWIHLTQPPSANYSPTREEAEDFRYVVERLQAIRRGEGTYSLHEVEERLSHENPPTEFHHPHYGETYTEYRLRCEHQGVVPMSQEYWSTH